jgi:hypothetical protein
MIQVATIPPPPAPPPTIAPPTAPSPVVASNISVSTNTAPYFVNAVDKVINFKCNSFYSLRLPAIKDDENDNVTVSLAAGELEAFTHFNK